MFREIDEMGIETGLLAYDLKEKWQKMIGNNILFRKFLVKMIKL
jgi:hypothetical protein